MDKVYITKLFNLFQHVNDIGAVFFKQEEEFS